MYIYCHDNMYTWQYALEQIALKKVVLKCTAVPCIPCKQFGKN